MAKRFLIVPPVFEQARAPEAAVAVAPFVGTAPVQSSGMSREAPEAESQDLLRAVPIE